MTPWAVPPASCRAGSGGRAPALWFSGGDLFELLAEYRVHPQGWGTDGAVLPVDEYRQRGRCLAEEALDSGARQARCLLRFPLLGVAPEGGAAGRRPDRRAWGDGREIAPATEAVRTGQALPAGHAYVPALVPEGWSRGWTCSR